MASVSEIKDALASQEHQAAELAAKSFEAIDTVTNLANFWLTFLSIGLAVLGLVGLGVIYFGTRRLTRKIAESRHNSYIKSEEGKEFVRKCIEEEVKAQIERRTFITVQPQPNGGEAFPTDPKPQGEQA